MKCNPPRHSSCVGESWHHFTFKVKYCHKIFDMDNIRVATQQLFAEACDFYQLQRKSIGFDADHVHGIVDIGMHARHEVAKKLKGYTAKKLFQQFPWLKKRYFWGSGLWSPSYYMDAVGKDLDFMERYVQKQKYGIAGIIQVKLSEFVHATSL